MKVIHLTLTSWLGLAVLVIFATPVLSSLSQPVYAAPTYTPPADVGKPSRRAGAGTRSANSSVVNLDVLAPEHTGLATVEQPTLYWSISKPAAKGVNFLLIAVHDPAEPVLETRLSATEVGIQSINLAEHEVTLKSGVIYEWSVSLPGSASNFASGTIKYISASAKLEESLEAATERDIPNIYAANGIWYNAVDSLSSMINEHPADPSLREDRIALLKQVDLAHVATFDQLDN